MLDPNRRRFLKLGTMAGGALALEQLLARTRLLAIPLSDPHARIRSEGYGALHPTLSINSGEHVLALPEGFRYTVIGAQGSLMSDGNRTPAMHDGMAAFAAGDEIRLVRNHEINNLRGKPGIAPGGDVAYDPTAGGGVTTLVVDPRTRELKSSFLSLSGTLQNCAGGPTPWGSWISCEETTFGSATLPRSNGKTYGGFEKEHGYCFEVRALDDTPAAPLPLKAMGRFVHEAVAVDPATGIVYETEDALNAGFYRFLPDVPGELAAGGRLQMLTIKGRPGYDTRRGQRVGPSLPVIWVDIDDPDPADAGTNPASVYQQGIAKGAATFGRLEGCWYGDGRIFINSTNGGDLGLGQVWAYTPRGESEGELKLIFESPSAEILNAPDNICVSPRGGLVLCEDAEGEVQHIRGLTPDGRIFDVARNILHGFTASEFAGATFSPDGQTLFVNLQSAGITLAIWGPWERGEL